MKHKILLSRIHSNTAGASLRFTTDSFALELARGKGMFLRELAGNFALQAPAGLFESISHAGHDLGAVKDQDQRC